MISVHSDSKLGETFRSLKSEYSVTLPSMLSCGSSAASCVGNLLVHLGVVSTLAVNLSYVVGKKQKADMNTKTGK